MAGRRTRVLSIRTTRKLASEITREAKQRKISKSSELKRRLDFYTAAQAKPAGSASISAT